MCAVSCIYRKKIYIHCTNNFKLFCVNKIYSENNVKSKLIYLFYFHFELYARMHAVTCLCNMYFQRSM